jgi:hypothetical protein
VEEALNDFRFFLIFKVKVQVWAYEGKMHAYFSSLSVLPVSRQRQQKCSFILLKRFIGVRRGSFWYTEGMAYVINKESKLHFFIFVTIHSGESNGKLPLRTCPGCSVPEPYQSPDWALVPAQTSPRAEYY